MSWYRWSVKAPSLEDKSVDAGGNGKVAPDKKGNTPSDMTSTQKTLSLHDTSPSLITNTQLSGEDKQQKENTVFVPESQYPHNPHRGDQGVSTPKTDISMDYILETSLRQRKIRTVDRVNTHIRGDSLFDLFPDDEPPNTSPIKVAPSSVGSKTKRSAIPSLLVTSPNLITSTPIVKENSEQKKNVFTPINLLSDMMNQQTQVLFDSPIEGEQVYSGHLPVVLPASFEGVDDGRVLSSEPDNTCNPVDGDVNNHQIAAYTTTACQTMSQTNIQPAKRPKFRSSPPQAIIGGVDMNDQTRKRVSFAKTEHSEQASTPSTARILSSLERNDGVPSRLSRTSLTPARTKTIIYDIPTSALSNVPTSVKRTTTKDSIRKSPRKTVKETPSKTKKKSIEKTKSDELANNTLEKKNTKLKEPGKKMSHEQKRKKVKQANLDFNKLVWTRWKPDRLNCLVIGTLSDDQPSMSTRSRQRWQVQLHSRLHTPIHVLYDDFCLVNPQTKYLCRLTKKPSVQVRLEEWIDLKRVMVSNMEGNLIEVPTRHLFIDSTDLLKNKDAGFSSLGAGNEDQRMESDSITTQKERKHGQLSDKQLFKNMTFILTGIGDEKRLAKVIVEMNGKVIDDMSKLSDDLENVYLLSEGKKRTTKYLLAIVLGIPRVSVGYIEDCLKRNAKLPISDEYYLDTCPRSAGRLSKQAWIVKGSAKFRREFELVLYALGVQIVTSTSRQVDRVLLPKPDRSVELEMLRQGHCVVLVSDLIEAIQLGEFDL